MSDTVSRLNAALEGRYTIERELGEGGMATVYLADDLKHETQLPVDEAVRIATAVANAVASFPGAGAEPMTLIPMVTGSWRSRTRRTNRR